MLYKFLLQIILIAILILSGCTPKPLVTELNNNTTTYDETISINNCGNKAESTQTASRSFSTKVSGTGSIKAGYKIIFEGSVSSTYEQYKNITKTQSLTAAPETNMEFILRWSDDVHTGNVIVDGESANYTVNIPISVAQISSRDLGCDTNVSMPTSQAGITSTTPRVNELISVEGNVRWGDSGIIVNEGDVIKISYKSGEWGGTSGISTNGWDCDSASYSDGLMSTAPGSSLIGRIGDSEPFCVGDSPVFTSQSSGKLYFSLNDCITTGCYSDNHGSVILLVSVTSK